MALQKKALLVALHISKWNGRKKDIKIADAASKSTGANSSAIDARKLLIDEAAFKEIEKAAAALRKRHYELTVPWSLEAGTALLPIKLYQTYMDDMRRLKDDFYKAVNDFIGQYPMYKSNAQVRLGTLYNEYDYPYAADLSEMFSVSIPLGPVPDATHVLVELEEDELKDIRNSVQSDIQSRQFQSVDKLWRHAEAVVTRCQETLSDPTKVFRDSLTDSLLQTAELLPDLNVLDDPHITKIAEMMKHNLCGHSAETLRHDKDVRLKVASAAMDILDYMRKVKNDAASTSLKLAA